MKYKVDPLVIDLIAKIYRNDKTQINMLGVEETLNVTSGIRQGCTVSTELFKLVTYEIIKKLEETGDKLMIEGIDFSSLFYADDSILVSRTIEEAERNLKIITEISKEFGLIINESKSKALIFKKGRTQGKIEKVGGLEVVKSLKYLGLEICDEEDIFRKQKELAIKNLQKLAKKAFYTIETVSDRVLMGKLFWKSVALPTALFGLGVMTFNIGQVETLQRTENRVNRMILRAARYAPNTTVRGEIGSSTMDSRIIESKFLLIKSIINGDNELVKEVLIRTLKEDNNIWKTKLRSQLGKVNMTEEDLWNMSKENIRKRIREVDKANWVKEMEKIKTLNVYR
ncbi:unnamed protein product, partial [Meganyctiphanes norvegica]